MGSQALIREAISILAGVFVGDVGPITFTAADPAVPIPAEANASTSGPNNQATGRRLVAGSVNAAFNISVPGLAAQGYNKDCSIQKIRPGAAPVENDEVNTITARDAIMGSDGTVTDP